MATLRTQDLIVTLALEAGRAGNVSVAAQEINATVQNQVMKPARRTRLCETYRHRFT